MGIRVDQSEGLTELLLALFGDRAVVTCDEAGCLSLSVTIKLSSDPARLQAALKLLKYDADELDHVG